MGYRSISSASFAASHAEIPCGERSPPAGTLSQSGAPCGPHKGPGPNKLADSPSGVAACVVVGVGGRYWFTVDVVASGEAEVSP